MQDRLGTDVSPRVILALDSALGGCGAGVLSVAPDSYSGRCAAMAHGQAEVLMPLAGDVLREAGLTYKDIDAVVTTVGPGGFTGLRVGLSAAQALALALDIPIYGLTTLQVLAEGYLRVNPSYEGALHVLVESRREDYFHQSFDRGGRALSEPQSLSFKDVASKIDGGVVIGDCLERFLSDLQSSGDLRDISLQSVSGFEMPDPEVMCRIVSCNVDKCFARDDAITPLYLRPPDVTMPTVKKNVLS